VLALSGDRVMHKLSIAHLSALDASPHQLIEIAGNCGFDFVGLRILPVTADETASPLVQNAALRREVVKHASDRGVGVLDVELMKLTPATDVRSLEPALEAAGELGARHALTQIHDMDATRAADQFAELCERAAPYNLTCDVEFLSWTEVRDIAAARTLLRAADAANGGICIDTLHFWRSGGQARDIESVPRKWIHFVQVSDACGPRETSAAEMIRVAREDRLMPGEGEIDLFGIVARLPLDVPLSLEVPNTELARRMSHEERMRAAKAKLVHLMGSIEAGAC
jgi:sugar phosphate isomerase/epimerase